MQIDRMTAVCLVVCLFAARDAWGQPDRRIDTIVRSTHVEAVATSALSGCDACADVCCCDGWGQDGFLDNLSIFGGLQGSKQPQDFGVNAHFGGRVHVNWGIPLIREWGIGAQAGTGFNFTDHAVQVVERIEGSSRRQEWFHTVGIFQSTASGIKWGVAYDFLDQDYFDDFDLGQWRGKVEVPLSDRDDVGVWFAFEDRDDAGQFGAIPVVMSPIDQGSVFWRHHWERGGSTTVWFGLTEGHSEANVALGDLPPDDDSFVFGADLHIPLNDHVALWGEASFIRPADTGSVDAYLGLVFYPSGGVDSALIRRFAPLFPVANSPTFAVNLDR